MLGLGKLGGHELNYSCDIDLIELYEGDRNARRRLEQQQGLFRVTRDLVQIIQERTGDGDVFRADLRLRPARRDCRSCWRS